MSKKGNRGAPQDYQKKISPSLPVKAINEMISLFNSGQWGLLETKARDTVKRYPGHPFGWKVLGAILIKTGRLPEAIHPLLRSTNLSPQDAEAHSNLGNALKELGRLDEAEASYRLALALRPDFVEAHCNLGIALKELGRLDEAEACYRLALALKPDFVEAHCNLGIVLKELGRLDEAEACYRLALTLKPDFVEAHCNLGIALKELDRLDEAIVSFEQAMAINPDNTKYQLVLIQILYRMYSTAPAAAVERALACRRKYLDRPIIIHGISGILGDDSLERASDFYVSALFDNFANNFDTALDKLGYDVPRLMADCLYDPLAPSANHDILDAGCGTGKCGPYLAPHARRLVGVDLSVNMLAKAQARGIYSELIKEELVSFLSRHPASFDTVVSADVLIYFGNIVPLIKAGAASLRSGGRLAFSVEAISMGTGGNADFILSPSGRYQHRLASIGRILAAADLTMTVCREVNVRLEWGKPTPGYVIIASAAHTV